MRGTLHHQDWTTDVGALTVRHAAGPADPREELDDALANVARLRRVAAAYVAASDCEHQHGICRLDGVTGGREACELAVVLAAEVAQPGSGGTASSWLAALRESCRAVWLCRRIAHPAGQCWFAPANHPAPGNAGEDVCGRVLGAAHRLG